jgi:hypothetical protein
MLYNSKGLCANKITLDSLLKIHDILNGSSSAMCRRSNEAASKRRLKLFIGLIFLFQLHFCVCVFVTRKAVHRMT